MSVQTPRPTARSRTWVPRVRRPYLWVGLIAVSLILQSAGMAAGVSMRQGRSPLTACVGRALRPADAPNIPAIVRSRPAGTVFCFAPGTYWMTRPIISLSNDRFIGTGQNRADVVLTGSKLLAGWTAGGGVYVHRGDVASLPREGVCNTGSQCRYSDWMFRAGLPLRRSIAPCTSKNVRTGIFCIDYGANRIYVHDNPTGVRMAYSFVQGGLSGGTGVVVRNLTLDKFAGPVGGTATLRAGAGWLVDSVAMQYNHGCAIGLVGAGTVVQHSRFHDNGEFGYCARATGAKFMFNEVDHNNFLGVRATWGGGGGKFSHSVNVTVAYNNVHDNKGNGIWFDLDSTGNFITGNTATNNSGIYGAGNGITYEISCNGTIDGNTSSRNGMAGIQLRNSHHNVVGAVGKGNTVANNRIAGIRIMVDRSGTQRNCGAINGSNNRIAQNSVTMPSGSSLNGVQDYKPYVAKSNGFSGNDYHLPSGGCAAARWWWWDGSQILKVPFAGTGKTWRGTFKQDLLPDGSCQ
jgi:parallel beta-helix repeat protein